MMIATLFSLILSATANVVGSDAQNFAPTQDGLDFVTVHSSEVLRPGIFNVGFFLNYATNTFPAYEGEGEAPEQSFLDKNDALTSADLNFAVGVAKNLQLGMSAPYILSQEIDSTANLGRFEGSGTSELRFNAKYHIGNWSGWGMAAIASANFNRIENNPYVGEDAGPTFNIELAVDKVFNKWNWAFNIGHRSRDRGNPIESTEIDPLPNQTIYSTALSYLFESIDTKLIMEIYGSQPVTGTRNLTVRQNSSLEALVGAKHDINQKLAFHFGMGSEMQSGTSTPDLRIYSGLNYAFGPVFDKPEFIERVTPTAVEITLPNLLFVFDKAELIAESARILDKVVERIKIIRNIQEIRVEGHTDYIGSDEYNQGLSERRAAAIQAVLKEKIEFDPEKITAVGFGETRPIADNGNFQGRQSNRRVEIIIVNR